MPYIPNEVVDRIRHEVNIIDIISQYVDLQKRGKNYFGKCPFHDERTPSFTVEANKQFYKCFSCGRGGNVFNFLMELEGFSFPRAVEEVSRRGHVTVDFDFSTIHESNKSHYNEKDKELLKVHEALKDLYHYLLMNTKAGEAGLNYLKERGLSLETLENYQIGWSPVDNAMSYQHLLNKGFSEESIEGSGVFVGPPQERRDRFAGRIVFPLMNVFGDVVGFSGRILPTKSEESDELSVAKYLNSPETSIFKKGHFLFNLNFAKEEVRRQKQLILFEGFMDVIHAAEAGVKYGVASLGTSLTDDQIQLLYRYTKQMTIAYDGDAPGQKATLRAIHNIQSISPSQSLKVLIFPSGLDPDEFIKKYGSQRFQEFVSEDSLTPIRFYRYFYRQKFSLTLDEGKLKYIQALLPEISRLNSAIEQDISLQEVSEDTGVSKETLKNQLALIHTKATKQATFASPKRELKQADFPNIKTYSPLERFEMQLLHRLLNCPQSWFLLQSRQEDFHFQTPLMETCYQLLKIYRENVGEVIDSGNFYQSLQGDEERQLIVDIQSLHLPEDCSEQEMNDLIYQIDTKSYYHRQIEHLNQAIEEAKVVNDLARINHLNQERVNLLRQLKMKNKNGR